MPSLRFVRLSVVSLLLSTAGCSGELTVGMFASSDSGANGSTSDSTMPGSGPSADAETSIRQACNDGTGAMDCCPAGAADGLACEVPADPSAVVECFTQCSPSGWRSTLSCTTGTWIGGHGLFPCGTADSGAEASVPTSTAEALAACDHYFAARYSPSADEGFGFGTTTHGGCGGPQLPAAEQARLLSRFEHVCQNQMALPGSGMTPAGLEACASAVEASPCEFFDLPTACAFYGSLPGGAVCNEGFQCESGQCEASSFTVPPGQIWPYRSCGTCLPAAGVGQACAGSGTPVGCAANATCSGGDASASTCVPVTSGGVGATCDNGNKLLCNEGLFCADGQCMPLADAGAPCDDEPNPPGNPGGCAPPLSCVGEAGTSSCSVGATGAFCTQHMDCAPGLDCVPGPCPGGQVDCSSGTCGPVTWVGAGEPCDGFATRCLVRSCLLGPGPGGQMCPLVAGDGQSSDGGATTCDTFAEATPANSHTMNAPNTCVLVDSVTCQ